MNAPIPKGVVTTDGAKRIEGAGVSEGVVIAGVSEDVVIADVL